MMRLRVLRVDCRPQELQASTESYLSTEFSGWTISLIEPSHSLTHTPTDSLTHKLTQLCAGARVECKHAPTHPRSLTHSLTHSLNCVQVLESNANTHPLTLTHSLTHSLTHTHTHTTYITTTIITLIATFESVYLCRLSK